jgi:TPR repeat protein
MYENGLGVPQDYVQALSFYLSAVEHGANSSWLHKKLAAMYEDGLGTIKDSRKAFQQYYLAAISGDVSAMKKLGEVYEKGMLGIAVDRNLSQEWYAKAKRASSH